MLLRRGSRRMCRLPRCSHTPTKNCASFECCSLLQGTARAASSARGGPHRVSRRSGLPPEACEQTRRMTGPTIQLRHLRHHLTPLPGVTIVLCWSHGRRTYVEALNAYPECQQALDLIGKLFEIERNLQTGASSKTGVCVILHCRRSQKFALLSANCSPMRR